MIGQVPEWSEMTILIVCCFVCFFGCEENEVLRLNSNALTMISDSQGGGHVGKRSKLGSEKRARHFGSPSSRTLPVTTNSTYYLLINPRE